MSFPARLIETFRAALREAQSEFGWRDARWLGSGFEVYRHEAPDVFSQVVLSVHATAYGAQEALEIAQAEFVLGVILDAEEPKP